MLFSLVEQFVDILSVVIAASVSCFVSKATKKKIANHLLDRFLVDDNKTASERKKYYAVQVFNFPKSLPKNPNEESESLEKNDPIPISVLKK